MLFAGCAFPEYYVDQFLSSVYNVPIQNQSIIIVPPLLCREIVEETYNALQTQLGTMKAEHTINMAKMATDTADAQKNYSDMCDKVSSISTSCNHCTNSYSGAPYM